MKLPKFENGTRAAIGILALVAITIAMIALVTVKVAPAARPVGFCQRHPAHPACISPTPSPSTPTPPPSCGSLQALVNAAPSGSTLNVAACTYRETVTINKPLTLITVGGIVDGQGVRTYGFVVGANDVTIDGFEVTGTTNPAQDGAIRVRSSSRFTLRNAYVHNNGGACISIDGGTGHLILDSELAYCAQEGFHLPRVADTLVARNAIHHNNPNRAYSTGWEAGGGKAVRVRGLTFDSNRVFANVGVGLWCDIDCQNVVFRNNVVHDNTWAGIMYEISTHGEIVGNTLTNNGWERSAAWWPWGANILVSSSGSTEVHGNLVRDGSAGITVASQSRSDKPLSAATGISVHDNTMAVADGRYGLSWVQDWAGPLFSDPSNFGAANRYWWPTAQDGRGRFGWSSQISTLSAFNATRGEEGGTYLSVKP